MIETNLPEENDSQSISVLDSEDENGTSACVTHSPRNISNSQASLLAFRALEDFVEKRESLRSVELMVRLDNITILHKVNRAVQRSSQYTILSGYKNINIQDTVTEQIWISIVLCISSYNFCTPTILISQQFIWILLNIYK